MIKFNSFKITAIKIFVTLFTIASTFMYFFKFKSFLKSNREQKIKRDIDIESFKGIKLELPDSIKFKKIETLIEETRTQLDASLKVQIPIFAGEEIVQNRNLIIDVIPLVEEDHFDTSFKKYDNKFFYHQDQYPKIDVEKFEAERKTTENNLNKHLAESYFKNIYSKIKQANKENRFDLALYDKAGKQMNIIFCFSPDKYEKYKIMVEKLGNQLSNNVERCLTIYHPYPLEIASMINSYLNIDDRINFSHMIKTRYQELKIRDKKNNQTGRLLTDNVQMISPISFNKNI